MKSRYIKNDYRQPLMGLEGAVWWRRKKLQKSYATVPLKAFQNFTIQNNIKGTDNTFWKIERLVFPTH